MKKYIYLAILLLPTIAFGYTVKKGDTLFGIARDNGVSISDISGFSSGNPDVIYAGEELSFGDTFGGPSITIVPSLKITGLLNKSCIGTSAAGVVQEGTCTGGGAGSISTSTAVTAGYFPTWGTTSALTGTSTAFLSGSNIGIGTIVPSSTLHIIGTFRVSGASTFGGNIDGGVNQLTIHNIRPDATDGLLLESANGTDVGLLGTANTANALWYGSHNYDAATGNTIASFSNTKTLTSLATSTYPSLTELSYVKGLTSSAQTQLNTQKSSGILTGGALSIGTGGAGVATTFTIAAGTGQVVDNTVSPTTVTSVSWSAKTDVAVTNLLTNLVTFVAIDSGGNVIQSTTDFTPAQMRQYIVIGIVVHSNQTTVNAVNQGQIVAYNQGNQLTDLFYGLGLFNVSGNIFSANGTNLKLNKSAGSIFRRGSNYSSLTDNPHIITTGALTQAPLRMQNQTGSGSASTTDVDVANYDLAGVTTAISPATRFSILRVFLFQSNLVAIQRGQATYLSLAEAKAAIQTENFVTNDILAANGLLRGFIVAQANATDLSDTSKVFFIASGKFGGTTGVGGLAVSTLQNAYDNSSEPEILTDSTRGALTIKRGSAADTDAIIEGKNNAGLTTFSLTGSGVMNVVGNIYSTSTSQWIVGSGNTPSSTLHVVGTFQVTATSTFAGNIVIGGDTISDFVGTGLSLSGSTLQTTLGTAIDISDETNLAAGDYLTLSGDTVNADAELASSTISFSFVDATSTLPYKYSQPVYIPANLTLTLFNCADYVGTSTVGIFRANSIGWTNNQNYLNSDIACGTAGNSTSTFATSTIPAGTYLVAYTTSTAGTPKLTGINAYVKKAD